MKKRLLHFGLGLIGGAVGGKILSTDKAKELAVDAVAGGLKIKDSIDKTIEKARENTNDIVAEAKVKKEEDEKAARERQMEEDIEAVANEEVEEEIVEEGEEKADEE
ncbi:MAG: DUF6110 family protein [Tissierellia bacterium]|nr:DUF6110 family protein [Tissierellia bacterium]